MEVPFHLHERGEVLRGHPGDRATDLNPLRDGHKLLPPERLARLELRVLLLANGGEVGEVLLVRLKSPKSASATALDVCLLTRVAFLLSTSCSACSICALRSSMSILKA